MIIILIFGVAKIIDSFNKQVKKIFDIPKFQAELVINNDTYNVQYSDNTWFYLDIRLNWITYNTDNFVDVTKWPIEEDNYKDFF